MEEKDFENLFDMFSTPGWKEFIKQAGELHEALTKGAVDNAIDNDQWQYLRGQLGQLRSIINYEDATRVAYADFQVKWTEEENEAEENVDSI